MAPTVAVLVESVARLLDSNERDAVLGDSLESGEGPFQALFSILGLVLRRQLLLWKSWRPWLAVFVFGLPSTTLLMYVSVSVTCTYDRLMGFHYGHWAPTGNEGFAVLACHIFLLIAWSWTSGFTLGSLSPRTLWMNAVLCICLAFYYADHFRIYSVWRFSPFLFLLPAIWGVRQGVRTLPAQPRPGRPPSGHHGRVDARRVDQQCAVGLQLAAARPRALSAGNRAPSLRQSLKPPRQNNVQLSVNSSACSSPGRSHFATESSPPSR